MVELEIGHRLGSGRVEGGSLIGAVEGRGARKIQAEIGKLGFTASLATVSRYLPKRAPDRGKQQRWITFLHNHKDVIAAMDFFVIPTVGFRLLYIWFIIDHGRRRIIHFNVTTNPSEQWVIQQLRESFPFDSAPRYLIYDNDSIFSDKVTEAIKYLGIEPKRTAYRSPWQNGTAERWVGSARRGRSRTSLCFAAPAHPCAMSCWIT